MTVNNGYAGNILKVDLSSGKKDIIPTDVYIDRFVGGRGIAAKIYLDHVRPESKAHDPGNMIIFMTGPVTGTTGFCGSRSQICTKSPFHDRFCYSNLGGSFGAKLKHAGFDGFIITGKAESPVYLWISENKIEIRNAGHLWGKDAISSREILKAQLGKSVRILTIGTAGENKVSFATLFADNDSSASSGMGAVLGSKNLKAIAVKGTTKILPANPDKLKQIKEKIRQIPVPSTAFGDAAADLMGISSEGFKDQVCYNCIGGCFRREYHSKDGRQGKHMCQSSIFYNSAALDFYGDLGDVPFIANNICNVYGVDTFTIDAYIMWFERCVKEGVLSERQTGLPLSKIGSIEFIETLVKKIANREGIGEILALGPHKAIEKLGSEARKIPKDYICKTGQRYYYGPRMFIPHGLFYAMEPRLPIQHLHEITVMHMYWGARQTEMLPNGPSTDDMYKIAGRFWGSEAAGDFTTYEGKALASAKIQDRQYAKECLILCDFRFPILYSGLTDDDSIGDPTIENQICSAVTGKDIDEKGLYEIGERVFNLQRAILVREGHRHRLDDMLEKSDYEIPLEPDFTNLNCMVPGKDGAMESREGMVIDQEKFEIMKDEYYKIRKWDVASGMQTSERLKALNLEDVSEVLRKEGLSQS
jgi:aldehyde:ferredoxin oxidoreductase